MFERIYSVILFNSPFINTDNPFQYGIHLTKLYRTQGIPAHMSSRLLLVTDDVIGLSMYP